MSAFFQPVKASELRKVDQVAGGPTEGNCLCASNAMVLGLPLEDVPFFDGLWWWDKMQRWARSHGCDVFNVQRGNSGGSTRSVEELTPFSAGEFAEKFGADTVWVAHGREPEGSLHSDGGWICHAVVYVGAEMFHDPASGRRGVGLGGSGEILHGHLFVRRQTPVGWITGGDE